MSKCINKVCKNELLGLSVHWLYLSINFRKYLFLKIKNFLCTSLLKHMVLKFR